MAIRIFVCAGDVSGDIHAARVVQEIKKRSPECSVTALGGKNLARCADEYLADLTNLSAFGFWAPLRLYFRLKDIFENRLKKNWNERRPDKVLLVDYYGFNIHVAAEAHRRGIPVYYYISPQVWATRAGRIRTIARYVKKMLVILPFEEPLYRAAGVATVFVGNPLLDMVPDMTGALERQSKPVIGLFPGSRSSVFEKHMPLLLKAAATIEKEIPAEFKIVCVDDLRQRCNGLPYAVVGDNDLASRAKFSLAVTTSGTVSLENALLGLPMLVFYKLSSFNYFLAKRLIRVPYITMVNILLNEAVVPELIQDDATPEKIASQTVRMLRDADGTRRMREKFMTVRRMLGEPGASARVADIILND